MLKPSIIDSPLASSRLVLRLEAPETSSHAKRERDQAAIADPTGKEHVGLIAARDPLDPAGGGIENGSGPEPRGCRRHDPQGNAAVASDRVAIEDISAWQTNIARQWHDLFRAA